VIYALMDFYAALNLQTENRPCTDSDCSNVKWKSYDVYNGLQQRECSSHERSHWL